MRTKGTLSIADLLPSFALRDFSSDPEPTRMSARDEANTGLNSNYRFSPDESKDTDAAGDYTNFSSHFVSRTSWNSTTCGDTGDIPTRVANCRSAMQPTDSAHWVGLKMGNSGEGNWSLVTRQLGTNGSGYSEVWLDETTGLLWSDALRENTGTVMNRNWQNLMTVRNGSGVPTKDVCTDDAIGTQEKGALGTTSGPQIKWRLPTRNDFLQGDLNGLRYALPGIWKTSGFATPFGFWSATSVATGSGLAWILTAEGHMMSLDKTTAPVGGFIQYASGYGDVHVRCVGGAVGN